MWLKRFISASLTLMLFMPVGKVFSQKRILFLGNSYTAQNNLPLLTYEFALSAGDTIYYESNAPGGSTLEGHTTNAGTLARIEKGGWDYVVLQEQSQLPSFPDFQVEQDVYPYAQKLDSLIQASNDVCTETIFYMTWGRKNGDQSNCSNWPPICTFEGMNELLRERYIQMAKDNEALISPVGALWHFIRKKHPELELYIADGSHPSLLGSYAAACSFYTVIFGKDPNISTYLPQGLSQVDADKIKVAARQVVYDSLSYWRAYASGPSAQFQITPVTVNQFLFSSEYDSTSTYHWTFGDGMEAGIPSPIHSYAEKGTYTVHLTVERCGIQDSMSREVQVNGLAELQENGLGIRIYPNPMTHHVVCVEQENVDFTQAEIWSLDGKLILSSSLSSQKQFIDLSQFSGKLFLLRLKSRHKKEQRTFLIRRP